MCRIDIKRLDKTFSSKKVSVGIQELIDGGSRRWARVQMTSHSVIMTSLLHLSKRLDSMPLCDAPRPEEGSRGAVWIRQ